MNTNLNTNVKLRVSLLLFVGCFCLSLSGAKMTVVEPGEVTTQTLFDSAKTEAGRRIIDQLNRYDEVEGEELLDLKKGILTVIQSSFPFTGVNRAEDLRVGYNRYDGITVYTDGTNLPAEFNMLIKPDGSVQLKNFTSYHMRESFRSFRRNHQTSKMFGLLTATSDGKYIDGKVIAPVIEGIRKHVPLEIPDGETFSYNFIRVQGLENAVFSHPDYYSSFQVGEDGFVMLYNNYVVKPGSGLLGFVSERDRNYIELETFQKILSDKPESYERHPRVSALYDALAVLMADRRFGVWKVKSRQLGSAKGLAPFRHINLDGLRDIDFGELYLSTKSQGVVTLEFWLGHFQIGTDLDKPAAWLYGASDVGNQKPLYRELKARFEL